MVESISVDVQGLAQLQKRLKELSPKIQKKVARRAVRMGANVIRDAARSNAKRLDDPATSNSIAKNIATQESQRLGKKEGGVVFRVGVKGGSKSKKGKEVGAKGNAGGDTWYWRLIEFGTVKMRAQPFMRPAMSSNTDKAIQKIQQELKNGLDKENA